MIVFRHLAGLIAFFAVQGCCTPTVTTVDQATIGRLQKTIIPEVDFKDAAVSEILNFFHFSSLPLGYKQPPIRQEINENEVVYFLPILDMDDPRVTQPGKKSQKGKEVIRTYGPYLTLSAKNISLLKLFERVSRNAHGSMVIRPDMLIIRTPIPVTDQGKRQMKNKRNKGYSKNRK